jgi:GTP pyrophosphokinase
VRQAYDLALVAHGSQLRQSGEPFFLHPLTVAHYLAEYHLDAPALVAALLHDIAEDTVVAIPEIGERFGDEVARLVDGVTKLKEVTAGVAQEKSALTPAQLRDATLGKLFRAMAADMRVVLIKLFDRLHNMRTIKATSAASQRRKAEETMAIYGPLADRLGIWRLKNELEALSLEILHPRAYLTIKGEMDKLFLEQQAAYAEVRQQITEALVRAGIKVVNVFACPENISTAYQYAVRQRRPFDDIDRTLRVVVLLDEKYACYLALGHIHALWRPQPGMFDDYIAVPRENLYRALHTTVIHQSGRPLKVRFRTVAMNELSEIGVLARWVYAGTPLWSAGLSRRIDQLFRNVIEGIGLEPQDPTAGVRGVVNDYLGQQIRVYTRDADIVELPYGATPIDFAYKIHTELGNQCQAAYINEQRQPLNRPLRDGDRVLIVRSAAARPHRTWLDEDLGYITTTRARNKVRLWFRRLSDQETLDEGKRLLAYELRTLGLEGHSPRDVALRLGYAGESELYRALGGADQLPTQVATAVLSARWQDEPRRNVGNVVNAANGEEYVVHGVDGRQARLCQSCTPKPGDPILGYIRNDGGVTVHKEGCRRQRPDPLAERSLMLSWGASGAQEMRVVTIQLDIHDRTGMLFEISRLMRDEDVNINAISTRPGPGYGDVILILKLEVASPRQLVRILHRVHALVNVFGVRVLPHRAGTGA